MRRVTVNDNDDAGSMSACSSGPTLCGRSVNGCICQRVQP